MEKRIKLTQQEAFKISKNLEFSKIGFVKDVYTGNKRIRTENPQKVIEKDYITPLKGTMFRFSGRCKISDFENAWFEVKWTKDKVSFEIEFEGDIPKKYRDYPSIEAWDILEP